MVESWECFNRLKFGNSHLQASKLRIRTSLDLETDRQEIFVRRLQQNSQNL
jgi:hypothetical protein